MRSTRARSRWLRAEPLEHRNLAAVVGMPLAAPIALDAPLEVMPTSPFIVSPFIDPLVIPEALAPGWRNPAGLAAADPLAWSVRETNYAVATPTGDPVFPVLEVTQRQYRFRFLDCSVSRIYEFAMMTSDAGPVAMPGTQGRDPSIRARGTGQTLYPFRNRVIQLTSPTTVGCGGAYRPS